MSCNPIAALGNFGSTSLEVSPIAQESSNNLSVEPFLKKVIIFSISHYLKKLSTNSYLLNTCKSSIPSPTPMYFTGI